MPIDTSGLTPAEMQEEVINAAIENRAPFDNLPRSGALGAITPADPDAFTAADLTQDLLNRCEPYPVPGTQKTLYVFPLSTQDVTLMVRWAAERTFPDPEDEAPPTVTKQNVAIYEQRKVLEAYQVTLCCRQGPSKRSKRCFSKADYHAVSQFLGYSVVTEICAISNRLSGNDETLGPGAKAFFGSVLTCLRTWSLASVGWEGCPNGLRASTEQLGSLVSRALKRGELDSGMLKELEEI